MEVMDNRGLQEQNKKDKWPTAILTKISHRHPTCSWCSEWLRGRAMHREGLLLDPSSAVNWCIRRSLILSPPVCNTERMLICLAGNICEASQTH